MKAYIVESCFCWCYRRFNIF